MKALIVIDVPVDEPCEIDELSLLADIVVYPATMSDFENLEYKHITVRPMPEKRMHKKGNSLRQFDYNLGWNACLDEIDAV